MFQGRGRVLGQDILLLPCPPPHLQTAPRQDDYTPFPQTGSGLNVLYSLPSHSRQNIDRTYLPPYPRLDLNRMYLSPLHSMERTWIGRTSPPPSWKGPGKDIPYWLSLVAKRITHKSENITLPCTMLVVGNNSCVNFCKEILSTLSLCVLHSLR